MAVNLSMLAGAGAQFFNDSGVPLTGGKIYSYAAGTTTPQATYTTNAGNVAHTNPIILDSAGRVPNGGEIWLPDALNYKFVVKDSTDVTIATYDNVANNASGALTPLAASSGSSLVGFIQSGVGAVATTVQAKLRETVSVLDFGADPTGATDSTAAIQAAINAAKRVYFPAGSYLCNVTVKSGAYFYGDGISNTTLTGYTANPVISNNAGAIDAAFVFIKDMRVVAEASHTGFAIDLRGNQSSPYTGPRYGGIDNVYVVSAAGAGVRIERCWAVEINKLRTSAFKTSLEILNGCNSINITNSPLSGSQNSAGTSLTDANVRIIGSPTEQTSIRFEGCTFENAYAQSIYALNVQGLQILNNYFENEATTIATQEIQLEQCPSAIISGNRVRMRSGVFDFVYDNTSSTSLLFSSGKLTIQNNILTSATYQMGVFTPAGATASQTTAIVENNSSNWPMFGPRSAGVGRQPRVRVSDYMLVMPQHNARYTSPGSTAAMPTDSMDDGWYVKKAEWVVDTTYSGGSTNTLYLEKRWSGTFVAGVVSGAYVCSLPDFKGSPFYQAAYKVQLTTLGTLPSPLTTGTDYYVVPVGANSFQLATSAANAKNGIFITITDAGNSTHTITIYGLISSGAITTPANGTVGDRVTVSLLSDGTDPSYKTGILSFGEYLYGYSAGGGSVDELGHWEITLSRFPSA